MWTRIAEGVRDEAGAQAGIGVEEDVARLLVIDLVEIQFERRDAAAYLRRSDGLADYVMNQDWVRTTNNYNPYLSPRKIAIYPERYQDYTMNGTLYNLWESIRLHPSVANTSLMIQYLKMINILGENFEEYDFYLQLHMQCMRAAGR